MNANPDIQSSKLLGFTADVSSIQTQLDQISAVTTTYANTLKYGVMGKDWRETYDTFLEALDSAGYQTIIDELQKQVDDYIK